MPLPTSPPILHLPPPLCARQGGFERSARLLRLSGICALLSACLPTQSTQASPTAQPDSAANPPTSQPPGQPPGQRPRSAAFDQALIADSNAALIMFLIHHHDDPALASVREVLAHRTKPDSPAVRAATAGAEAEVVGAFDAARLAGTASAWQGFLARYPGHILASETGYFSPR